MVKKTVTVLNILLLIAMVIHMSIGMYAVSQDTWTSFPIWAGAVYWGIYYIPVIAVLNLGYLGYRIWKLCKKRK